MNVASPATNSSTVMTPCLHYRNRLSIDSFNDNGPPSVIEIPSIDHDAFSSPRPRRRSINRSDGQLHALIDSRRLSTTATTANPNADVTANLKRRRWSPNADKLQALCSASIPKFPLRQDSFYAEKTEDETVEQEGDSVTPSIGSCDHESDTSISVGNALSILSECEKMSVEVAEMLKGMESERWESSQGTSRKLRTKSITVTNGNMLLISSSSDHGVGGCATDDSFTTGMMSDAPRRPYRQSSFRHRDGSNDEDDQQEKRWCSCTAGFGSYNSLPEAAAAATAIMAQRPQMPRRQKSNVDDDCRRKSC